ncbi:unnamed protein product, partial [Didymodactylos carnosus]
MVLSGFELTYPYLIQRHKNLYTLEFSFCGFCSLQFIRMPSRMTIICIPSLITTTPSSLIIISPCDPLDKVRELLNELGQVKYICLSNRHHCYWAKKFHSYYPLSTVLVTPGLQNNEYTNHLINDNKLSDIANWPYEHLYYRFIPGMPLLDEVVFYHRQSQTLIVTDLAFNYYHDNERDNANKQENNDYVLNKTSLLLKLYLTLAGGRRRCCLSYPFRLIIKNIRQLKFELDYVIYNWNIKNLIMAHGHPIM